MEIYHYNLGGDFLNKKETQGPLKGIVVLDLTNYLSGPLCTMMMADLGAEVIKIERFDKPKASGPFLKGERVYDLSVNRSKKSICLNLKSDEGRKVFYELSKKADVVVENFKPGTVKRMKVDYDTIKEYKENIIYASISGFGQTGPYSDRGALDMVIQGMSGLMSLTGPPDGKSYKAGTSASDIFSGLYTFGAISSALYYRAISGRGQYIDVAMLDCTFSCLENAVINTLVFGENPKKMGNMHPTSVPFQTFDAADGEIIITCSRDPAFYRLCKAMDREDMIEDERYSKAEARRKNRLLLEEEIEKFTKKYTLKELEEILNKFEVPNGVINKMLDIVADPQISDRGMIAEVIHPIAGKYKMAANPIKYSLTKADTYFSAPVLGEDTEEVLKTKLNYSDEKIKNIIEEQKRDMK